MVKRLFILVILLVSIFPFSGLSQDGKEPVRLIKTKPSVYLSFEKLDSERPLYLGESDCRAWLRLSNNSIWDITVSTAGISKEYGSFRIPFEVIERENPEGIIRNVEIPTPYRSIHVGSVETVRSGKSIVFSVPLEYLSKEKYITVAFGYEWEQSGPGGGGSTRIMHKASFFGNELSGECKVTEEKVVSVH